MQELAPEQLRKVCDPAVFEFETTHDGHMVTRGLLGQERAEAALRFGLAVKEQGYNLTVAGARGTGKTTAVNSLLQKMVEGSPIPEDWCYVNNFQDPFRPRAIKLPAGLGRKLRTEMEEVIQRLFRELPRAFEGEEYTSRREAIGRRLEKLREETFGKLSVRVQAEGFLLQGTPVGFFLAPVVQGRPIPDEEMAALPEETRNQIIQRRDALMEEARAAMKGLRVHEREATEQAIALDKEVATQLVTHVLEDLQEVYAPYPDVEDYLRRVEEDLITNVHVLRGPQPMPDGSPPQVWPPPAFLRRYQVNLAIDNSGLRAAPIIFETNPTPTNLLGKIEREAQFGTLITDFTMVRTGTLHQANGGYLVIDIDDILRFPLSWDGLKRAIRDGRATVEELGERVGVFEAKSLRPDPIPWRTKVILIGPPDLLGLMRSVDPELGEFFKVKVDFDSSIDRTPDTEVHYAQLLATLCRRLVDRAFDRTAVAAIVEHASRVAEDQGKLSTQFSTIIDIVTEASHWADVGGSQQVQGEHVRKALEQRTYRAALVQDRLLEMTRQGTFVIHVTGDAIGTVNGLTVYADGEGAFGRPVRITATAGLGREGVIDIEREVQLAGPIFGKAMLILSGFLADRFSQDKLLAVTIRIVFEQTYGGIEGDSASCAEVFALFSQLADLPLRQGLAVTGSMDQFGRVQAIGGVNEKVEGFFDTCKAQGLTGDQGAIIPSANVRNLMLREDVVEAVRAGQFHVYAIDTIDEGLELLTGLPAGVRGEDGWPDETVNGRVDFKLAAYAATLLIAEQGQVTLVQGEVPSEDAGAG